jgi:hypothetical protein
LRRGGRLTARMCSSTHSLTHAPQPSASVAANTRAEQDHLRRRRRRLDQCTTSALNLLALSHSGRVAVWSGPITNRRGGRVEPAFRLIPRRSVEPQARRSHRSRCGGFAVDLRLVAVDLRWIVHQTAPNTGKLIFVIPSVFGLFSWCSVLFVLTKTIGATCSKTRKH